MSRYSNYDHNYYLLKFINIHSHKYEYPNLEILLLNSKSKIDIICNKCNEIFRQTVSHHLWSKSGCRNCYGNKPNTIEKIIKRSEKIHGKNRYSYPLIHNENISSFNKITIICNNCQNIFNQSVTAHLNKKNGCNKCNRSKCENLIESYLVSNNIEYIPQHEFNGCFHKKNLKFDFFLPKYNLCIEYDGEQHFIPRRNDKDNLKFNSLKIRDNIKNEFCIKNKINLERISYRDNLQLKLKELLNKYSIEEIIGFKNIFISFNKKTSKKCTTCKEEKSLKYFYRCLKMTDGHKSSCKNCTSLKGIKYREKRKIMI